MCVVCRPAELPGAKKRSAHNEWRKEHVSILFARRTVRYRFLLGGAIGNTHTHAVLKKLLGVEYGVVGKCGNQKAGSAWVYRLIIVMRVQRSAR